MYNKNIRKGRLHPSLATAASKGGGFDLVTEIDHYLSVGGLFLFVLIIQCNDDGYDQSNQGYCKPRKTNHQRQNIFHLHGHHLPSGRLADRPYAILLHFQLYHNHL